MDGEDRSLAARPAESNSVPGRRSGLAPVYRGGHSSDSVPASPALPACTGSSRPRRRSCPGDGRPIRQSRRPATARPHGLRDPSWRSTTSARCRSSRVSCPTTFAGSERPGSAPTAGSRRPTRQPAPTPLAAFASVSLTYFVGAPDPVEPMKSARPSGSVTLVPLAFAVPSLA